MNIIITFLSKYRKSDVSEYTDSKGLVKGITGSQTNDAPIDYFLKRIYQNESSKEETKILCVTTQEVLKVIEKPKTGEDENAGKTSLDVFKDMVKRKSDGLCEVPEFILIPYDYRGGTDEIKTLHGREKTSQIYRYLASHIHKDDHVYIDFTGGFRDTNFLMTVITRYLEFMNISSQDIIYSNYPNKRIYYLDYIYDLFNLISGVENFVTSGKSKELRQFFKDSKDQDILGLLSAMDEFSDCIAICDVEPLNRALVHIQEYMKRLESRESSDYDIDEMMFISLIQRIKEKFYIDDSQEETISHFKVLKWCVENDFLQQALTVLIEKMPYEYYDRKWLNAIESDHNKTRLFYETTFQKLGNFNKVYVTYADIMGSLKIDENATKEDIHRLVEEAIKKTNEPLYEKEIRKHLNKYLDIIDQFEVSETSPRYSVTLFDDTQKLTYPKFKHFADYIKSKKLDVVFYETKDFKERKAKDHSNKKDNDKKSRTYINKVATLQMMDNLSDEDMKYLSPYFNLDEMRTLLDYYLRFKIYRNQINHASIRDDDSYHEDVYYDYKNLKGDQRRLSAKNVREALNEYIAFHESLMKKYHI